MPVASAISCGTSPLANVSANEANNCVFCTLESDASALRHPASNSSTFVQTILGPETQACVERGSQPCATDRARLGRISRIPRANSAPLEGLSSCRQFSIPHRNARAARCSILNFNRRLFKRQHKEPSFGHQPSPGTTTSWETTKITSRACQSQHIT